MFIQSSSPYQQPHVNGHCSACLGTGATTPHVQGRSTRAIRQQICSLFVQSTTLTF